MIRFRKKKKVAMYVSGNYESICCTHTYQDVFSVSVTENKNIWYVILINLTIIHLFFIVKFMFKFMVYYC